MCSKSFIIIFLDDAGIMYTHVMHNNSEIHGVQRNLTLMLYAVCNKGSNNNYYFIIVVIII